ncbi:MAG TPA: methyltransferase type 12 [Myxococcota bacterium]|nr:methyltransferase type 12 [Myxococcota bacterium]
MVTPNRARPASTTERNPVLFFQGFLKRPGMVGSVIPSSRYMERRIVKSAGLGLAKVVVELGPGTGGTTRAILRAMAPDAKLVSIEINPDFLPALRAIPDPRLIVHEGSAVDLSGILASHDLGAPDVVLSGIPFSTMKPELGRAIVRAVSDALSPGGRFVAYQVRDRVEKLGREVFGPAAVQLELRNVPPMRVYRWEKR